MSKQHNFIPGFEFDCIGDIISIVRAGELTEKKWEVVQHASWFLGCAAAKLDGQPVPFADIEVKSDRDLEMIVADLESMLPGEGFGLDVMSVLAIVKLIYELLSKLR